MDQPKALLLSGPPGAGKTTVGALVAATHDRSVHLEADRFFRFIKGDFVEPWLAESHEQNTTVIGIVGGAATGYARAGYVTIVDGILVPGWFLEPLAERLRVMDVAVSVAILRPSLEVAIERAGARASQPLSDPEVVKQLCESFSDLGPLEAHVFDNSDEDPERTAAAVDEAFRSGLLQI